MLHVALGKLALAKHLERDDVAAALLARQVHAAEAALAERLADVEVVQRPGARCVHWPAAGRQLLRAHVLLVHSVCARRRVRLAPCLTHGSAAMVLWSRWNDRSKRQGTRRLKNS